MNNHHSALMPDYYQVLDLPATAAPTEIRSAARQLTYQLHANRGGRPEEQILIKKASRILLNPIERETYDRHYRSLQKITAASFAPQPSQSTQPKARARVFGRWSRENFLSRINFHFEEMVKTEQKANQARKEARIEEIRQEFQDWKRITGRAYRGEWEQLQRVFGKKVSAQQRFLCFSLVQGIGSLLALVLGAWSAIQGSVYASWLFYLSLFLLVAAALAAIGKLTSSWMRLDGKLTRISGEDALDLIRENLSDRMQNEEYSTWEIEISLQEQNWERRISEYVNSACDIQTAQRIQKIQSKKSAYLSKAKKMLDIIRIEVDFETPQELVMRKIAVALFLMGFLPSSYEPRLNMVTFHDGEEELVVRYRLRPGNTGDISYLKRLAEKMQAEKIAAGYIFCKGGVAEREVKLARKNRVSLYSLDRLNEWIQNVAGGSYCGPAENLFLHIERMERFLGQI